MRGERARLKVVVVVLGASAIGEDALEEEIILLLLLFLLQWADEEDIVAVSYLTPSLCGTMWAVCVEREERG